MVCAWWGAGSCLKRKLSSPSPVLREGCHLTPKITATSALLLWLFWAAV